MMDAILLLYKIARKTIKYLLILYIVIFLIVYGFTFSPDKMTKNTAYSYMSILLFVTGIDFAGTAPYLVTAPANLADDSNTLNYRVKIKYLYAVDLHFCMANTNEKIPFYQTKIFNLKGAYYSIIIKKDNNVIENRIVDITYFPKSTDTIPYTYTHYSACGKEDGYISRVISEELLPGEYQVIIAPIDKENNIKIFGSEIKNGSFTIEMHPDMTL